MLYALVFKQLSGENPGKKACWKSATLIIGGTKTAMQTQITTNVPCSRFFPLGYGLFGCMLLLYPRALPDELCTSTGLCYWNAAKSPAHILRFQFRGRPAEDILGVGRGCANNRFLRFSHEGSVPAVAFLVSRNSLRVL